MLRTIPLCTSLCALLVVPAFAQEPKDANAKLTNIVETASSAGQFQTLLAAAKAAGLADMLANEGPFTVFAPSDKAFDALPEGTVPALLKDKEKLASILKYHVVAGNVPASALKDKEWLQTAEGQALRVQDEDGTIMIDDATVVQADVKAKNGVIHVIDQVLMPREDIVKIASDAGSFTTLCKCVKAAGLTDTLSGKGPFTVFAPNDAAFAELSADELAMLMKDTAKLKKVLTYHVVPGRILAEDIPESKGGKPSAEPKTVEGSKLTIVRDADGNVTVNGVRVIRTDIIAGNGVIHVLEAVVMPTE